MARRLTPMRVIAGPVPATPIIGHVGAFTRRETWRCTLDIGVAGTSPAMTTEDGTPAGPCPP